MLFLHHIFRLQFSGCILPDGGHAYSIHLVRSFDCNIVNGIAFTRSGRILWMLASSAQCNINWPIDVINYVLLHVHTDHLSQLTIVDTTIPIHGSLTPFVTALHQQWFCLLTSLSLVACTGTQDVTS